MHGDLKKFLFVALLVIVGAINNLIEIVTGLNSELLLTTEKSLCNLSFMNRATC